MNRNRIEDFGPYQDAFPLFDGVVEDVAILQKDPRCYRLVGQQIGSADSICANIDKGFGRISRTEYIRFLDISRGSAREPLGRYKRLKHWLPQKTIDEWVALTDRIISRLTHTIQTLKANNPTTTRSTRHPASDTHSPDTLHPIPNPKHGDSP
ncbi:MAG: four helix bundle protein [Pontiellaceae bacterium]|jgi:four helix bundle protein|nr:four helix bundle protein [Pontiellaceae bacterium]